MILVVISSCIIFLDSNSAVHVQVPSHIFSKFLIGLYMLTPKF